MANEQRLPALAGFQGGAFIATWSSMAQDGSFRGVYGQAYSPTGATLDVEFLLNTMTTKDQWQPAVAPLAVRVFLAAWPCAIKTPPSRASTHSASRS